MMINPLNFFLSYDIFFKIYSKPFDSIIGIFRVSIVQLSLIIINLKSSIALQIEVLVILNLLSFSKIFGSLSICTSILVISKLNF